MNINSINPSKVVNFYNSQTKKVNGVKAEKVSDSIEISSVGKNMSLYSLGDDFSNSDKKIQQLKSQIENGTYKKDSKLIADKIFNVMKDLK